MSVPIHSGITEGARQFQSPGHLIPVVPLQQEQNHGEEEDDNHHNASDDGSRTYKEDRGGDSKRANRNAEKHLETRTGTLTVSPDVPSGSRGERENAEIQGGPQGKVTVERQCTSTHSAAWGPVSPAHHLPKLCLSRPVLAGLNPAVGFFCETASQIPCLLFKFFYYYSFYVLFPYFTEFIGVIG